MPLRDHFQPPISLRSSWEGFHGGWPMAVVQQLSPLLPADFSAEPRVHLGGYFEIDVSTFEDDVPRQGEAAAGQTGGLTTARWTAPQTTLTLDADLAEPYEYAVEVYDHSRGRRLVAAVEIVSPANKDRPESRRAFVTKCAALLQQGVCVSIVDLVTTRNFNLYVELLALLACADPKFGAPTPAVYAVTCRQTRHPKATRLETWAYPLVVGQPLSTLPLWLSDELAIPLDLESSYEATCRTLRIP